MSWTRLRKGLFKEALAGEIPREDLMTARLRHYSTIPALYFVEHLTPSPAQSVKAA